MPSTKTKTYGVRVAHDTIDEVSKIAEKLGYTYAERGGSVGQLLDAIARGDVQINSTGTFYEKGMKAPVSLKEIFSRITVQPNGCWEWKTNKSIRYAQYKGKTVHRMVFTICYGKIFKKQIVCHHCDNPKCCNPLHLFLGDAQDNMIDMVKKGRHPVAKTLRFVNVHESVRHF